MFSALQTVLLERIAPQPGTLAGSSYEGRSKLRALLGDAAVDSLRGTVIDFGCGDGRDAVELARTGLRVVGIDISEKRLAQARRRAEAAGLSGRCTFAAETAERADAVISLDAFEHFEDPAAILRRMHGLLKPGGVLWASFGPIWYHPLGGHALTVFPWSHVLLREEAILRWWTRRHGVLRTSVQQVGLNKMTLSRFERIVRESPFRAGRIEAVPIRKLRWLHCRLTREFTTAIVRCRLVRP